MPESKGRRSALAGSGTATAAAPDGRAIRQIVRVDGAETHHGHPAPLRRVIEMSPRQEQILRLLAQGLTDKEIGQELEISPRTVQTHMKNFLGKNRIRTRIEAVATWSCQSCQAAR